MNKFSLRWLCALVPVTLLSSCEGEKGVFGMGLLGIFLLVAVVVLVIVWVVRKLRR